MATIITRSGKGEPLTNDEVDANFDNLNADKVELSQDNTWTGSNAFTAGLESEGAGANSFRAGTNAGATSQGIDSVAIGFNSGASGQITSAVSVGRYSGNTDQEVNAVAIGNASGRLGQKSSAVGIGPQTGEHGQGGNSVSIGNSAGQYNQGDAAISIGNSAGRGTNAAGDFQGIQALAIGALAGRNFQGAGSIALGALAGVTNQGANGIIVSSKQTTALNDTTDGHIHISSSLGSIDYTTTDGWALKTGIVDSLKIDGTGISVNGGGLTVADGYFNSYGPNGNTTNVSIGQGALANADSDITAYGQNVGIGTNAGINITTGNANLAIGGSSMLYNITGNNNTAVGQGSLLLSNASNNTCIGTSAGSGGIASNNTVIGKLLGTAGLINTVLIGAGDRERIKVTSDSLAVGNLSGQNSQGDNGIIINSTGAALDDTAAGHIHIASSLSSIDYTSVNGWRAGGQAMVVADIVAASSDFADFQAKVAALQNPPVTTNAFVSVWATTAINETITIPTQAGTFNAVVDWGDGTTETITSSTGFTHVYTDIDDYTISITGTFPNIYMNGSPSASKLKRVTNLGTVGWTTLQSAFRSCSNLTDFTSGSTDTSAVSITNAMFYQCFSLVNVNISSFDITGASNIGSMFTQCTSLVSIDVSSFDTSSVTQMGNMFGACNALTSIVGVEDWDVTGLNSTGSLTNFITGGSMTTAQYDNLLIKWEAQSEFSGMSPSFGASTYTSGGTAAAARAAMLTTGRYSAINDGGIA